MLLFSTYYYIIAKLNHSFYDDGRTSKQIILRPLTWWENLSLCQIIVSISIVRYSDSMLEYGSLLYHTHLLGVLGEDWILNGFRFPITPLWYSFVYFIQSPCMLWVSDLYFTSLITWLFTFYQRRTALTNYLLTVFWHITFVSTHTWHITPHSLLLLSEMLASVYTRLDTEF